MSVFDIMREKLEEHIETAKAEGDWTYIKPFEIVRDDVNQVEQEYNNGWIPAEQPPKDDKPVLLSFANFSVPLVGRYEEDESGGAYYVGDEDVPLAQQDIFVNAWMPLPEQYKD